MSESAAGTLSLGGARRNGFVKCGALGQRTLAFENLHGRLLRGSYRSIFPMKEKSFIAMPVGASGSVPCKGQPLGEKTFIIY